MQFDQCAQCVQWPQLPSRVRLMTLGNPGCAPVLSVSYANHAAQVDALHHLPFLHLPLAAPWLAAQFWLPLGI